MNKKLIVSIISGVAVSIICDWIKNIPVLSTIKWIFTTSFNKIIFFLNLRVKIWILLVVLLLFILFCYLIKKMKDSNKVEEPSFIEYTSDNFMHWKWSWGWMWNNYNKHWQVTNLRAHCPSCDTVMNGNDKSFYGPSYKCPRCQFYATCKQCDLGFEVESVIIDNIRRKRE